ncbi:hypothetical protein GCM10011352_24110 [Marinobacterium zhoushanense]|uniref:diguanylate cyclase n=1 Tax=Marinobacterium zhoushanense TaxID=1679163 RepID=A0ABQ1KIV2_9GAMM|nr:GGDEF domain-containing protein [Marinobacterium zhoushanense]GGB97141.1 hypothetical protein GCM10011352_24110 [Marinobacterium zhoushanense]
MNTIKIKFIAALTLVSLLVGAIVLILTPYMVKHEIVENALEHRSNTFEKSIKHFIEEHGSWGSAGDAVAFANSADFRLVEEVSDINQIPIKVTVFDQNGHVLHSGSGFTIGSRVDIGSMEDPEEIYVRDEVVAYMAATGDVQLSPWEKAYLHTLEETLFFSVLMAIITILPFGIWHGSRLVYSLKHLTRAVNSMAEGKLQQQVPINSGDEVGVLAQAFNSMNQQLVSAYKELETSRNLIADQAEKLKELSIRDELTGLYNRRFFNEEGATLMASSVRYNQPLSIVLGDVDHFKKINDNYSHATGDAVLKQVSKILQQGVRASDLVARFGGEEMVLALPNTSLPEATEMIDRIRAAIADYPWSDVAEGLSVTMSFGVSADESVQSLERRLDLADTELYRAKREGRNRVCACEPA